MQTKDKHTTYRESLIHDSIHKPNHPHLNGLEQRLDNKPDLKDSNRDGDVVNHRLNVANGGNPNELIDKAREDLKLKLSDKKSYLQKRQELKQRKVDRQLSNKHNAIDAQKSMGKSRKVFHPINENDPLVQLRDSTSENVPRVIKKDTGQNGNLRDRLRDNMVPDMNPRKLLEKRTSERNTNSLNRGDDQNLHRQTFGKVDFPAQLKDEDKPNSEQESRPRIAGLGDFDMESYLAEQRLAKGQGDPMRKFQFNQVASDTTPPDRYLKDYRPPA